MKNNDILNRRNEIREKMCQALQANDTEAYQAAFDSMMESIRDEILAEYDERTEALTQQANAQILAQRGVRQLTSEERGYYQKLITAMQSRDPQQAVTNLDSALPQTIVNDVFASLQANHPLLSHIDFIPTGGAVRLLVDASGVVKAVWGSLTSDTINEITAGLKNVDTMLCKLSAVLPVAKPMLELGPEWMDRFIRDTLYEAIAVGMETGIVTGTGKDQPIGMDRQVGDEVSVMGGVYPQKELTVVNSLDPVTYGGLLGKVSVDPNGRPRVIQDLLMLVNPADYYTKVMPATTVMGTDGTYRRDVLPYPTTVIPTPAVKANEALFGDGKRYFACAGTDKNGRIEASDHAQFAEDNRVYLAKVYANGMPKDDSAFLRLDITGLKPAVISVEAVTSAKA